jgi:transposase-like protein
MINVIIWDGTIRRASSSCGTSRKLARGRMTKPKQSGAFSGHRFPPEIIAYAVWAYHRFPMSLRDVEDLLAARGVVRSLMRLMRLVPIYQEPNTRCPAAHAKHV